MLVFEINNNWVKVLWGKNVLQETLVSGVAVAPIASDSQEEIHKAVTSIADAKTLKKYKPLILCISRSQVTLRSLKFPSKDEKELDNIVKLHIAQQVPYSREDIVYSYTILEKFSSGYSKVLLGIMHKDNLRKQLAVFERMNLYPESVQLGSFGLIKFLHKAETAKDNKLGLAACLDIDSDFSDFLIFEEDKLLFSKSIPMGYSQIKQADNLPKFIGEIKKALVVFQTEENRNSPSQIYFSGIDPRVSGFDLAITRDLQLSTKTIDPFDAASSLKNVKDLKSTLEKVSISSILGVAQTFASTKLNFVLPEAKMKKNVREMTKNLIMTGSIIVYLLVFTLAIFMTKIYSKEAYLDKIKEKIISYENKNEKSVIALDKMRLVNNFTRQKDSFLYYYLELTKIVPRNIMVDRLIFGREKEFSLIGSGVDMGSIFKFVKTLGEAHLFGKVELRYTRKKVIDKREFNEFEIICHTNEKG